MKDTISNQTAGLIVAAGSSRRMGFDKILAPLCGRPLVCWSIEAFDRCPDISVMVLVCADERRAEFEELAAPYRKLLQVVGGGRERADSVRNGLEALSSCHPDFVAVHDAARPLVTPEIISGVIACARETGSAVAAEPVSDTIHRSDGTTSLVQTVPRADLWAMQTPQVARPDDLSKAIASLQMSGQPVTDEISALIAAGHKPQAFAHGGLNFKVTFPRDLEMAAVALGHRLS